MKPFLVYELEQDQPSWSRRDRWSSCEEDSTRPVRLNANLIGCFVADDETEACTKAAQYEQRAGNFLAVEGAFRKIDFTAAEDDNQLEKLMEPPKKKHFCCCYGHPHCTDHPPADDELNATQGATGNLRREPNATEGVAGPAAARKQRVRKRDR